MRLVFLVLLFLSSQVSAAFKSGNDLIQLESDESAFQHMRHAEFHGYVQAIVDVADGSFFCTPPNATLGQLSAIVKKYLDHHPEEWNQSGASLTIRALQQAFPCPKPNKK